MFLRQFYVEGLGHSSYLLGSRGLCAVIDPKRDVDDYIRASEAEGLKVAFVLETHLHADFVSGHIDLMKKTGAKIYVPKSAKAEYPHVPVKDGDAIKLGGLVIKVMETPGHTPEMVSYIVVNKDRSDDPALAFTGDTLFVNDVGRPDLFGPGMAEKLTKALYDSLYKKLGSLPDWVQVYPAHGSGSLCGRSIGAERWSVMGYEKRNNGALKQKKYDDFKRYVLQDMPEPPAYFFRTSEINRAGPVPLAGLNAKNLLSPPDVKSLMEAEAVVLDCRSFDAFAGGHIEGAINIGISPAFPTWAGNFIPFDKKIILVLQCPEDLDKALKMLYMVGLDDIAGYMTGMTAWHNAGMKESHMGLLTVEELREETGRDKKLKVIDVRTPAEWKAGHISGATHLPLMGLGKAIPTINPDGKYATVCGSGYRASIAASMLKRNGINDVRNVAGSMGAWNARKFPVVK